MTRYRSTRIVGGLTLGLALSGWGGCLNADTVSTLLDISAGTTGSVVEVLVRSGLGQLFEQPDNDPALDPPLADQEH